MDRENIYDLLERILLDENEKPQPLPIWFLESITNNFSVHNKIGEGGFAEVYKGLLRNHEVAVKKLISSLMVELEEAKFIQEVGSMMRVKHKYIVRFLGYCSEAQGNIMEHEGKTILAEKQQRFLCFEFLQNGSLDKYISDASQGLDWNTQYQIIKGICEGLHYLHQQNIVHLDLKPANILLDHAMVPKIADFGLAKCFNEGQTRAITSNLYGTMGYMAPEFLSNKEITFKSDIYSLGTVITEILTGQKKKDHVDDVVESWRTRFKTPPGSTGLERHVEACAVTGFQCMESDPLNRPTTRRIMEMFNDLELTHGPIENIISASPISSVCSSDDLLEVYPLELRFPLERSKRKDNAASECSVTLTNRTDDYVGVWITPINSDTRSSLVFPYMWEEPCYNNGTLFRGLRPHTSLCVNMAMKKKHEQLPLLQEETDMLFQVTMIPAESEKALKRLESDLVNGTDVLKYVATKIYWTTLRAVTYDPEKCQDTVTNQMFIREIPDFGDISSIDVHPTETWVLVGHKTGHVSIWNYETKWRVNMFKVTSYYHISSLPVFHKHVIHSTKFIVGEQWFAAMDGNGSVHIYDYTTNKKMMEFQAHYCPTPGVLPIIVMLLAVHPTEPLLLTAHHKTIKLWDWSQEWACTRTFDAGDDGLLMSLEFGPRDTYTFVSGVLCKGGGHVVKAWDIHSSDPAATLHGGVEHTCYTDSHQHFLVTTTIAYGAKVWDLQTKKCVHQLYEKSSPNLVACHPTLPVLATVMKNDSRLGFWDSRTYRHMKSVELYLEGSIISMVFNGSEDITRLVVASDKEISVIKINMPALLTAGGN